MLRACVDVQVAEDLAAKTVLGEHTLDCSPDEFGRPLLEDLLGRGEALATGIAGVAGVHAVGHLLSAEGHLLSVDHDDVVTAIDVGGEAGLGLATKDKGHAGGETTKCEISRVNDNPLLVYSRFVKRNSCVALCVHCLDL